MIQGRASFLEIWDEVNPDHPSTFMVKQTEPQRPKIQDYQAKPDIEVPTKKSDLTKDGLRAFKEDKEEHQENIQDWKIQHNLYKEQRTTQDSSTEHSHSVNDRLTLTGIELPLVRVRYHRPLQRCSSD
ncbi:hypothetical protein E4U57_004967 [Claviceps arundinis]|uniref:Uncharacterized protein n=1 Tax=Claviceps arundinis TaxID=1623583 RepID=A0A9P7MNB9_9HYPO|nr:hypothetical protein E4U57_004967 [Claviceps arundinis]KAG5959735.1 hypothetical protein E4U56_004798 [Claviceps arundinis]